MMNYSDYDSDGYSSNEDADYVPSGEEHEHLPLALTELTSEANSCWITAENNLSVKVEPL